MVQLQYTEKQNRQFRLAFIIFSALLILVMPMLSHNYGQSGDEWLQIEYGQHVYDYFFHGDKQALDYTNKSFQYSHQEYYGGFFDFTMQLLHSWFPSIGILVLRHFFNALLGALMMVFTGLLAQRLTKRWSVGLIALLFIAFSPRIFGESMNNPKDIPFAASFIMAVYFLIAYLQDFPKRTMGNLVGLAIGWGIAFGVRSAGGVLLLGYLGLFILLYLFFNKDFREQLKADNNKLFKRLVLQFVGAIIVGFVIGISTWPWGLQAPVSHTIESLKGMTNRAVSLRVLFEGRYTASDSMPWYYEFKWIFISNPLVVLAGTLLFVFFISRIRRLFGFYAVIIVLFGALFPLLYMIYKESTVYDTWRHVFFVYPFWAIAGAMGWNAVGEGIRNAKLKWLPEAIAIVGLVPAIAWTVRSHPNQYVYFNELVGGIEGAAGYYETDYYQNSALQDAKWILKNVPKIPGRKVLVGSNMLGFDKYFAKDTSWITSYYVRFNERHQKAWDYYVTYSRYISPEQLQNEKWPPANAIHVVKVAGVPLSAVLRRTSTAGIAAFEALQKNDFETAVRLYGEYVKTDPSDENAMANYAIALASTGQMDAAVNVMNQAIALDPARVDFYQILVQIYKATGDLQRAQQAANNANAIIMREQEGLE